MAIQEELTQVLCNAIDIYRNQHCPGLTHKQILIAVERIRFSVTEHLLKTMKTMKIKT